ncbi:MAG: nitroreductase family protein [Deltaproteobacteria bacterium]|nr:nitroreductase family protein [Deltaproteobacteria bacterium]MBW2085879.1 nitroreductase family protein [Deltaproteobacteria bacterium]
MADFMDIVKGRRSIRKYDEKEIPAEHLNEVLEAVRWAPSWANTQCWEIVIVRDQSVKEALRATLGKGNPAAKAMIDAPVVIALCGKLESSGYYKSQSITKLGDWFMFDLGIATQNLCLAAHNLGLGTVIVGFFNFDKAAEVLGVPQGYELVAFIPMGYAAKDSPAPKRREISEFTHHDKF